MGDDTTFTAYSAAVTSTEPDHEPSLREQLKDARAKVEQQIDRLRPRPYPYADGGPDCSGGLFRTNLVMIDNTELIAKLTDVLDQIDDALQGLAPDDD